MQRLALGEEVAATRTEWEERADWLWSYDEYLRDQWRRTVVDHMTARAGRFAEATGKLGSGAAAHRRRHRPSGGAGNPVRGGKLTSRCAVAPGQFVIFFTTAEAVCYDLGGR